MRKTKINKIENDWIDIKNKCRTTVNKGHSDIGATSSFKRALIKSEHSPIRLLKINWIWEGIKSWVSVHYARHHVGIEKWISTQRSDRTGENRDEIPQGALVNFEAEATAQSAINMARCRLCFQASPETRSLMEDYKITLKDFEPELSHFLVPNCIYRCGCPEFKPCKFFNKFLDHLQENNINVNILDIDERYDAYNEYFYRNKGE